MVNTTHAKNFMTIIDAIEAISEADYALKHLQAFNEYLAVHKIEAMALLASMESLYKERQQ
jgi:hypothetical protein